MKFLHPLPIHVQVDFLPSSASLPWEAGEEEEDSNEGFRAGHRSSGTGHSTPGGMSVLGDGLELTYRRSARRMGGLEASVGAVSLLDVSPGTAFSRIVSPGKIMMKAALHTLAHLESYCRSWRHPSENAPLCLFFRLTSLSAPRPLS